jgi:signal transduction histidine kinase
VPLDPTRVIEALDELIGNAVEHTPAGTPIKLSARLEDGWLVVAVADSGPGIPRSEQARIFDRFARVGGGDRRDGTGLGLAIVKAIAEAHNGSVAVRSEQGHGATFELRFPFRTGTYGNAGDLPVLEVTAEASPILTSGGVQ